MIFNEENKKPQIEYPYNWPYKIIGENIEQMITAVEEVVIDLEYELTPSNISRKGKIFQPQRNCHGPVRNRARFDFPKVIRTSFN
ncbi:MAG: DUF493 domain-containing protein [bacterium]|nr:DUF493 domain-containing protein [bacterium]